MTVNARGARHGAAVVAPDARPAQQAQWGLDGLGAAAAAVGRVRGRRIGSHVVCAGYSLSRRPPPSGR